MIGCSIVLQVIPNKELPEYIGHLYKGLRTCQSIMKEKNEQELNGFMLKVNGQMCEQNGLIRLENGWMKLINNLIS